VSRSGWTGVGPSSPVRRSPGRHGADHRRTKTPHCGFVNSHVSGRARRRRTAGIGPATSGRDAPQRAPRPVREAFPGGRPACGDRRDNHGRTPRPRATTGFPAVRAGSDRRGVSTRTPTAPPRRPPEVSGGSPEVRRRRAGVPVSPGSPAAGAPLRQRGALGSQRAVPTVAGVEPRLVR